MWRLELMLEQRLERVASIGLLICILAWLAILGRLLCEVLGACTGLFS